MLIRFYEFEHALHALSHDGIHFYDIPSIVVVCILIAMGLVHWYRHRKRQKNMEEELLERLEAERNFKASQNGRAGSNPEGDVL